LKGDDDVPDFQIPDDYLNEIRSKSDPAFAVIIVMKPIDRTSYAWFDDLTEGILVALGGQNDALVIADRIKLEILAAEAAEEVDADVCASDFFFFLESIRLISLRLCAAPFPSPLKVQYTHGKMGYINVLPPGPKK